MVAEKECANMDFWLETAKTNLFSPIDTDGSQIANRPAADYPFINTDYRQPGRRPTTARLVSLLAFYRESQASNFPRSVYIRVHGLRTSRFVPASGQSRGISTCTMNRRTGYYCSHYYWTRKCNRERRPVTFAIVREISRCRRIEPLLMLHR